MVCSSPLVHAYIDPGTGSLLANVLLGVLLTLFFTFKGLIYELIGKLGSKDKSLKLEYPGQIVIFNEGKNYWNVFKTVMLSLVDNSVEFIYLTAGEDDPGLEFCREHNITSRYLGHMSQALFSLRKISAKTLLTTTPQLGILSFKRSDKVEHYCHLLHAPIDIHVYKKFAFDDFDSVMCSSSYQMENLRALEQLRGSEVKELLETGCTYYDNRQKKENSETGDAILFAPTWGDKSFLRQSGTDFLDTLLNEDRSVIFRPHPQSWISEPELIDDIIKRYESNKNFTVDRTVSNVESINRSKIIICDFSGIIYDFILLEDRPVIAVRHRWGDGGYESSDLKNRQSAEFLVEAKGRVVEEDEAEHIVNIIDEVLETDFTRINTDDHIFNFGRAGEVAAKQLVKLHRGSEI